MVVKISYSELTNELQKQLSEYSTAFTAAFNNELKKAAEMGADELKQGRPYHNRSGQYVKGWSVTQRKGAQSVTGAENYTIHNKKRYQITHLLEKGHLSRNGKRVQAFEHIAPTERHVEETVIKGIERAAEIAASKG